MFALFKNLVQSIQEEDGQWESLEELAKERADIAICHAFEGFGMGYDEAFELLKNAEDLTNEQRVQRSILIAAVDNLVDFAVAEEYQVTEEVLDYEDEISELDEDSDEYDELMELLYAICDKYNGRYAYVENMDIEYAMIMAAYLASVKNETELMYMTMGDERVRPWHLQYEGFTAPRSQFPAWLIPPIEHQCRCYLVEVPSSSMFSRVKAQKMPEMPDWMDRTFKESVANGGRIFSDEHPYFQIDGDVNMERLQEMASRIKSKYLSDGES